MELDILIANARAHTLDQRPPVRHIGVWNGYVVALDGDALGIPARRRIDLGGQTILPGFHDAHTHITSEAIGETTLDLSDARDAGEVRHRIRARAAALRPGDWLIAFGLTVESAPLLRDDLDALVGGSPAWITHVTGHSCVLNSAALDAVGLTDAAAPEANIGRGPDGRLDGLVRELAMDVVKDHLGPASVGELVDAIEAATRALAAQGITSFVEAGIGQPGIDHSPIELAAYQLARDRGLLAARAQVMVYDRMLHPLVAEDSYGLDLGMRTGLGDPMLRVGAMKVWIDGSGLTGEPTLEDDPARLVDRIVRAHRSGWQIGAHAATVTGLDVALDAFEALPPGETRIRRHRIEHAGPVTPGQRERMARLGVVSIVQPPFLAVFGSLLAAAPPLLHAASTLRAGIPLAASSDRPVAPGAPLAGIQALVTRELPDGSVHLPDERLSVEDAIRAYTVGGAYASHQEDAIGRIGVGMRADLVVLTEDPLATSPGDLAAIGVVATLMNGRATFDPDAIFEGTE